MSDENFSFFKKLYEEYKEFGKEQLKENYKHWIGSVKLPEKKVEEIFLNFRLRTFFTFLDILRTLYFSKSIFEAIKKYNEDIWFGFEILSFLLNKNLIKLRKDKVIFKENFDSFFIKPLSEKEIMSKLQRSLRMKIDLSKPLLYNLSRNSKFKWKANYDQIPITTKSAVSLLSKISYYFPARLNFAFLGDDDFLSIPFKIIFNMPTFSLDKDKDLLSEIERICKKRNIDIVTLEADVLKPKNFGSFYGCYTNPPYNFPGSTQFIRFASKLMGKEGGIIFLVLGNDAIGRRFVHLQREIANLNLVIREVLPSIISYGFYPYHKEDKLIYKKMKRLGVNIKWKEVSFAALYVLEYVGKVKRILTGRSIYSYV
jgi:predicted methyltransferase